MRRWLRFGTIGVSVTVAAAVVGLGLFAVTFDPNTQKDRIIEAVRRATGRELVLAGPLRLSLGWAPTIEAEDAAFANRAGGSRPQMATVARLQASVALLPLLSRRVEVESVTLDRPDILLETDAQGVGNWQFEHPAAASGPASPSVHRPRAVVALHRLVVENGRVTWRNGATGRMTAVDVPHATLVLGTGDDHLVADAQTSGQSLHLDAVVVPNGAGPWPAKLTLDGGGAHLALDGAVALPLSDRSYQGRVDATIPDLAAAASLLRLPPAPPLHDVRLRLVLGDDLTPHDVSLHVGASDLAAFMPGATLTQLDMSVPAAGQPGRLSAEGALPGGPWQLTGGIVPTRQSLAMRALNLATPGGDLAGDVAVIEGERWALRGTLVSQRLDLDWLRSLTPAIPRAASPANATTPAPTTPATPAPTPVPPRVFSDTPLPWARLRAADADLQLSVGTLHVGGADVRGVAGHFALRDGVLRLDPLVVQGPEGRIDGSLGLDASQPEPPVSLALRSAGFAVDALLRAAGLPGGSEGPSEMDVALHSAGSSPHALASQVDGHVGLAMVDGNVSNAALSAVLGDLVPSAAGRLDPAGHSGVRCLALRLDAKAGQVTVAALKLDTSRLDLEGSGTFDLANETLALRLRPTVRVGGAGVLAPVRAEGGLRHPAVAMDSQGVEGRAGIVIGGPGAPDNCGAALTIARDGHPGRLPATITAKAVKPADLLRSLLR
jgi:uncharacterized protein involved in outer membrane biogenesis